MQEADNTALAAEVDAPTRHPVFTLEADWNQDGDYDHAVSDLSPLLQSVTVERSYTSDLPQEVSLVDGYASADLKATLAGETSGIDAAAMFSAYRTDSPLAGVKRPGTQIRFDAGMAVPGEPVLMRQFTGQLRSAAPSSSSRTVELQALDATDLLRAPITLPRAAVYESRVNDYHGLSRYPWTINSSWVIDYVLRRNGIYHSPPNRDECILSATGRGSLVPEVGMIGPSAHVWGSAGGQWGSASSVWTEGPWGGLAVPGHWNEWQPYQELYAADQIRFEAGVEFCISFWIYTGNDIPDADGNHAVFTLLPTGSATPALQILVFDDGRPGAWAGVGSAQAFGSVPSTARSWRFFAIRILINDDGTATLQAHREGVNGSEVSLTLPDMSTAVWRGLLQVNTAQFIPWSDLQIWRGGFPSSFPEDDWTSQADLGRGMNNLTYIPETVNVDSWTLIQDVTKAEYGLVGFGEEGRFFFKPRNDILSLAAPVKTITATSNLKDLAMTESSDSERNSVAIAAAPGMISTKFTAVFDSDNPWQFFCQNGTYRFPVELGPYTIGPIGTEIPRQPASLWTDSGPIWGWVAVAVDAPSVELTSGVTVIYEQTHETGGDIVISNTTGHNIVFVLPSSSTPSMRIAGFQLVVATEQIEIVDHISLTDPADRRVLTLESTPWRQNIASLRGVANSLTGQLASPGPVLADIPIIGDPRLQLGDPVSIKDPDGLAPEIIGYVVKKVSTMDAQGGLADTITLRALGAPGILIAGDPTMGIACSTYVAA